LQKFSTYLSAAAVVVPVAEQMVMVLVVAVQADILLVRHKLVQGHTQ
tara:strand:+ start:73 stop:213 length:141 start_codon:yes stop_codon:yes gene_type:complete